MKILSIDELYKLNIVQLKELTLEQINVANQNIRELEQTGYASLSQAYQSLSKRQGKDKPSFSTNLEGLNYGQLVSRYVASSSYNALRTSNAFGTKEVNVDLLRRMGIDKEKAKKMVEDIALNEVRAFHNEEEIVNIKETYGFDVREYWKIYRNYESDLVVTYGSTQAQSKLLDYMTSHKNVNTLEDFNLDDYNEWLEQVRLDEEKAENEREKQKENRDYGKLI